MIGRAHHVVIDCPDPRALAAFYSELLSLPVTYESDDWVVVSADDRTSGYAFQFAPGHVRPRWPDPAHQQQFHLDVMVSDLGAADVAVRRIGAHRLDRGDHVYEDPAGHPFCLVPAPGWATGLPVPG